MSEFANQTVVITGAASGIGRAVTEYFIKTGANVIGIDRDESGLAAPQSRGGWQSYSDGL